MALEAGSVAMQEQNSALRMKTMLAFIASVLGFGALFLVLDLLLFNAQGLSFVFKG